MHKGQDQDNFVEVYGFIYIFETYFTLCTNLSSQTLKKDASVMRGLKMSLYYIR